MTFKEVMEALEGYGNPQTKKVFTNHGAKEPFFGVKVQDLKKIVKKVKKNHELSIALYDTGNSDAMYLAGLIADEKQITKEQLQTWADQAYWYMISEYTVPWVAAESEYGLELALEWIESDQERIASAGWATLSSLAAVKDNSELDIKLYKELLERAEKEVHSAQNRVRYTMNGFVISTGTYIKELTDESIRVAEKIGKVYVEMGGTSCKVPLAKDYINKIILKDRVGIKRKTARC